MWTRGQQDGQTATKSPVLPASAQIGLGAVHDPERVLIPPKYRGEWGGGVKPFPMSSGVC